MYQLHFIFPSMQDNAVFICRYQGQNGVHNGLPHCLLFCLGWVPCIINSTIPFCSLLYGENDNCIMTKDHLNGFLTFMNANVCLPGILLSPNCSGLTLVLTFTHCVSCINRIQNPSDLRNCKHYGLS